MRDASMVTATRPRGGWEHRGTRRGERGAGRLKAVIWLVILVAGIYAGIKIVPVLFAEYQFQDAMQTTARYASVNRQTPEDIRKILMAEVQKQDIPLMPEDIHIASSGNGTVTITADYSVAVDLIVYQLTLNFHPSASNKPLCSGGSQPRRN